MLTLFLKLLMAHILGDFVFQPGHWVEDKKENKGKSKYLYLHALVHGLFAWLLLGFSIGYWKAVLLVVVTHCFIDYMKVKLEGSHKQWWFIFDQMAHISVIAYIVHMNEPYAVPSDLINNPQLLLLLVAILSVTVVAAITMQVMMSFWDAKALVSDDDSLNKAGHYIGMLERLFVFLFVILQQWQAVGFLFAAKSVFRFNDLSKATDRKLTEYILIGTLMSFGMAIVIGLIYQKLSLMITSHSPIL